jgi:hypothetical protein
LSFLVDDNFPMNPKVVELLDCERADRGEARYRAMTLWVLAGAHCKRVKSRDGAVTAGQAKMLLNCNLRRAREAAEALVAVGLWVSHGESFRFHEWTYWQAPKKNLVGGEETPSGGHVAATQTPSGSQVDGEQTSGRGQVEGGEKPNRSQTEANDQPSTLSDSANLQDALTCVHGPARDSDSGSSSVSYSYSDPSPSEARATGGKHGFSAEELTALQADAARAERFSVGYLARFKAESPSLKPHRDTSPESRTPWRELARDCFDEQVEPLLDAFFADESEFCRDRMPSKLISQRVRLLKGPGKAPTKPGGRIAPPEAPPASAYVKDLGRYARKDGEHV